MKILDQFLKDPKSMKETFPWLTEDILNYIRTNNNDKDCKLEGFLSYSHKDKKLASLVKNLLKILGLEAFLAHENIKPSVVWEEEIIKKLKECNVFVPILTKNFYESEWTNQESGAAIVMDMEIIPISIAPKGEDFVNPHGFLGKYQALNYRLKEEDLLDENDLYGKSVRSNTKLLEAVVEGIKNKTDTISKVRNCFVKSLLDSISFAEANLRSKLLGALGPFDSTQLITFILGYAFNDQIKNASFASMSIEKLVEDNFDKLDSTARSIWEASRNKK